ncbi:MAG TPA: methyltransferase domain-containing protein, partial [candidate division WOR-3 bacterium]|nr:methyltransferase domain-containing protein [candidate division WOR-3 bacterium]
HIFDERRFHVRVHKLGQGWKNINSTRLEAKIGEIILKNSNKSKVVFDNPDIVLNIFLSERIVLGTLIGSRDGSILKRRPGERPFSLPISMEPRVARAMVNMARLREGQRLLDPFCGTGGILIEAGLMGIKVFGSDIDERMVKGTIINLEFYGIKPEKIVKCDIREIHEYFDNIDGIVCDPPYGRSASTFGENSTRLYEDSFKAFKRVLKPGGYAVISFPNEEHHIKIGAKYMKLKNVISYRVHKSLTRYIGIYQNQW